ncbi:MAG: uL15 family ribosomal protein [Clostridiales bacterium]|nr:uL15 family ribosomal protein [Clostridiales bacterium]
MLNSLYGVLLGNITFGSMTFTTVQFIMYVAMVAAALILTCILVALIVRRTKSNSEDAVESVVYPQEVKEQPVEQVKPVEQPIEEVVEDEQPIEAEPVAEQAAEPVEEEPETISEYVENLVEAVAQVEAEAEPVTEEPIVEEESKAESAMEDEPIVVHQPHQHVEREVAPDVVRKGKLLIRYDKSFTARLIQADDDLRDYYNELKNELLSYTGVKSRISWKHESFRKGRETVAKLKIRGKHVTIYLALDPAEYLDSKYKIDDVSHVKANADTPCAYAIKNDRRCLYAKDLIAAAMAEQDVDKQDIEPVHYTDDYPYDTTEHLIKRELIKLIYSRIGASGEEPLKEISAEEITALMAEEEPVEEQPVEEQPAEVVEEPVEEEPQEVVEVQPAEEPIEEVVEEQPEEVIEDQPVEEETIEEEPQEPENDEHVVEEPIEEDVIEETPVEEEPEEVPVEEPHGVTVEEAKSMMSDEEAQQNIEQSARYADKTKSGIINVDTLSQKFKAGEKVTLEEIKKRVPGFNKKTTYVKVLARGVIDKPLTVEADEYSIDAIKMIVLAGGTVVRTLRK